METCPECGADLSEIDIRAHALNHYPFPPSTDVRYSPEAKKRRNLLMEAAKKQERTPAFAKLPGSRLRDVVPDEDDE